MRSDNADQVGLCSIARSRGLMQELRSKSRALSCHKPTRYSLTRTTQLGGHMPTDYFMIAAR